MSYSTRLARLGYKHRDLSSDDVIRLMHGDPAMVAKIEAEELAAETAAEDAAARRALAEYIATPQRSNLVFYVFVLIPAHIVWLLFMPKPPWTAALLKLL